MKISGSILSMKNRTRDKVLLFEQSGVDMTHLDIMDGIFVNHKSLPIEEVKEIINDFTYDVHLMVEDVKKYIDEFKDIKPNNITFHYEVGKTEYYIDYLRKLNIKVGLAINPSTEPDEILKYLPLVDIVLIMSVNPGLGGQEFMINTFDKLEYLYNYRTEKNLKYQIEVDGGINIKNIYMLSEMADIVVVGSYITNSYYKDNVDKLKTFL